ncbi:MAG: hypothetical protein M3P18_06675 [Actinomycetota bacterium]|nr:hypothetical protein [Actinomycetota bacterium]
MRTDVLARSVGPISPPVVVGVVLAVCAAALPAIGRYTGNTILLICFVVANGMMLVLALPRPRLYGYAFLALFLFLGFGNKVLAFWTLGIALEEPTGGFDGSGQAWDAAILPSIAAAIALVTVRLVHLRLAPARIDLPQPMVSPPTWYLSSRVWVMSASVALVVALNALNLVEAFYQIGLKPRLILPANLNVAVSWLLTNGMALWIAMLVGWELAIRASRPGMTLLLPLIEAMVAVSLLSRASFLFRALSYVSVAANHGSQLVRILGRQWIALLVAATLAGFIFSLAAVSVLRTVSYPPRVLPPESVTTNPEPIAPIVEPIAPILEAPMAELSRSALPVLGELKGMLVGRWIGIEGAMAVASYPGRDITLFARSLIENPASGQDSLYQHVAGSPYATSGQFVFLTTPGVVAVLYYSGSLIVVFIGVVSLGGLLILAEMAAARFVRNAFVVSLAMLSVANGMAQMTFPYLFIVLCVQEFVTLGTLAVVNASWRWERHDSRRTAQI